MAAERLMLYLAGDPSAQPQPYTVYFEEEQHVRGGFRWRYGLNQANESVVQKTAVGGARSAELLAREARLGRRLRQIGSRAYPPQLSRFIGDNPDGTRPYTLTALRGRPLGALSENGDLPLTPTDFQRAVTNLLEGLSYLHTDRIVHSRICLDTLYWDGSGLQITDFGYAVAETERRTVPRQPPPWEPPRPEGDLSARRADDVYAAALVIFHIGTGEALTDAQGDPETARGLRARLVLQDSVIRELLSRRDPRTGRESDNALADAPENRPQIATLLTRWRPSPGPAVSAMRREIDRREAQSREDFARLRERQRAFALTLPPPPSHSAGGSSIPSPSSWTRGDAPDQNSADERRFGRPSGVAAFDGRPPFINVPPGWDPSPRTVVIGACVLCVTLLVALICVLAVR